MKVRDRIDVITELFLGALHCDGEFSEDEREAAIRLLSDLLCVAPADLPKGVLAQIESFSLESFDLQESAANFLSDPPMAKRRMLELLGKMVDADGQHDWREDLYLRALADEFGMAPEDYEDLVVEIEISDLPKDEAMQRLRESFLDLVAPPPIPPEALA